MAKKKSKGYKMVVITAHTSGEGGEVLAPNDVVRLPEDVANILIGSNQAVLAPPGAKESRASDEDESEDSEDSEDSDEDDA